MVGMSTSFVHLRVHSEFSLIDGLVRVGPLMKSVASADMGAIAITDRNNFFGLIKAYKAAEREGVKLIVGADFELLEADDRRSQITCLAQNHKGYRNLTVLISRAYQEGQILGRPLLRQDWIESHSEGLLALSGGRNGDVGQHLLAGRESDAEQALSKSTSGVMKAHVAGLAEPVGFGQLKWSLSGKAAGDGAVATAAGLATLTFAPDRLEASLAMLPLAEQVLQELEA